MDKILIFGIVSSQICYKMLEMHKVLQKRRYFKRRDTQVVKKIWFESAKPSDKSDDFTILLLLLLLLHPRKGWGKGDERLSYHGVLQL